jgi:hypothetical protein
MSDAGMGRPHAAPCYLCHDTGALSPRHGDGVRPCPLCVLAQEADGPAALRGLLLRAADGRGELSAEHMATAVDWLDDLLAARAPHDANPSEDTVLLDFAAAHGFGTWHDARTRRWVSMAGNSFLDPRAALRATMERLRRGRLSGRHRPAAP